MDPDGKDLAATPVDKLAHQCTYDAYAWSTIERRDVSRRKRPCSSDDIVSHSRSKIPAADADDSSRLHEDTDPDPVSYKYMYMPKVVVCTLYSCMQYSRTMRALIM